MSAGSLCCWVGDCDWLVLPLLVPLVDSWCSGAAGAKESGFSRFAKSTADCDRCM